MEGKIIKKTVPNVPLVREKPKEEILEGEIGDELEEIKEDKPEQLRAGRRNLKKKKFFKNRKNRTKERWFNSNNNNRNKRKYKKNNCYNKKRKFNKY